MKDSQPAFFREVQRFNQWWLWLLILVAVVFVWYGAYTQLIQKRPFGTNPAPDGVMVVLWIIFGILFPLFFRSVKLVVEVRGSGLFVCFFPFHLKFKRIAFS